MIRALVFDLDGLILDTESAVYASWQSAYHSHGVPLPLDLWHLAIGSDETHFEPLAYLLERRPGLDVAALQAQRGAVRDQRLAQLAACAGVPERIAEARARGLRLAVASSSERSWVEHHLDRLGLRAHFSALRCREDVARVKPDPALYRGALEALGVAPEQAVAFEDSPNGVTAAVAAGMRCVAVPGPMTRGLRFDAAHLQLGSLAELPLDEILARVD
ncbi:MAG: HAD family hydrolase [Deltaproteobacteria bacterium]|nr:MAG: HAD family hydrolase [Deltaproteobacteria bacterium]